jgi:hypothetical protein
MFMTAPVQQLRQMCANIRLLIVQPNPVQAQYDQRPPVQGRQIASEYVPRGQVLELGGSKKYSEPEPSGSNEYSRHYMSSVSDINC